MKIISKFILHIFESINVISFHHIILFYQFKLIQSKTSGNGFMLICIKLTMFSICKLVFSSATGFSTGNFSLRRLNVSLHYKELKK